MADRSAIEWTDATWNPIRARVMEIQNDGSGKERIGWHCEHVSDGCRNCYAETFNRRLGTGRDFKPGERFREDKVGYNNGEVKLFLDETMLAQPLRWKKPRKIFVCSMTDLFADFVSDEMLDKIFAVMALTPQHTYQLVTKRAARMNDYISAGREALITRWLWAARDVLGCYADGGINGTWPLPNVWLGVSAERQAEADERIPLLLETPAAKRFISAEPLLGPLDLKRWMPSGGWGSFKGKPVYHQTHFMTRCEHCGWFGSSELCPLSHNVDDADVVCPACNKIFICDEVDAKLHWVIVGGESGSNARAMHPDWARGLRDQCRAAGVAFFFKQWGEWAPSTPDQAKGNPRSGWRTLKAHPHVARAEELYPEAGAAFIERLGKKAAGRHLDGELHSEFPAASL